MVQEHRRLAAIVSSDVVGYSRLMGRDESGTLAALRRHRVDVVEPILEEHGGRLVKTIGDGMLIEFSSVVAAIRSAQRIQHLTVDRFGDGASDNAIDLRIGIHLGDVIVEDDDIFGDGVNVAARLQEIAEPRGIAISQTAYEHLDETTASGFTEGGEHRLKNLRRPIRVWRWPAGDDETVTDARDSGQQLQPFDKPSIAVLPFSTLSGGGEDDYFGEGVAEDLISALAQFSTLYVTARNSSFLFRGRDVDLRAVGAELGVRYALLGSVRRSGAMIRIVIQLADTETGAQVWSSRYDREMSEVFALQDEITESVAGAMGGQILSVELDRARKRRPRDLDAWEMTLRGLWHLGRGGAGDVAQAESLALTAIEREQTYALSYALLSICRSMKAAYGWSEGAAAEMVREAGAAARTAINLDANDETAHVAMGFSCWLAGRHDDAIRAYERALELSPNFATASAFLGQVLAFVGEPERAVELLHRAVRLSPKDLNIGFWHHFEAMAEFSRRNYNAAIACERRSIGQNPEFPSSHRLLASCYGLTGQHEAARSALAELNRLLPAATLADMREQTAQFFARPDDLERLLEGLRLAGMPEA